MHKDSPEVSSGEHWSASDLQQRLRRSIQQLAVRSGSHELLGRCEHHEFVDDLETKLFLADSPEAFHRVAYAMAAHLHECSTAAADFSAIARGIQLYVDLDSGNPSAETAASNFLGDIAMARHELPDLATLPPKMLADIASYLGYAVAGGVNRR